MSVCVFLSSTVSFVDCGGGKVWFKVGDSSDFRVSEDGVVYALRGLSLAGRNKAMVVLYAQDLQSKKVWKTRVHLHVRPNGNISEPEQVKQWRYSCIHVDFQHNVNILKKLFQLKPLQLTTFSLSLCLQSLFN